MGKGISKPVGAHERQPVSLSELIHQHVRVAIETAVHEELRAALGTMRYERNEVRRGYRNGIRERTLTGPTGPVALALPRATLFRGAGGTEWTSTIVPRYQRRMPEVNEAVIATYLAGGNTRRIRGALQPLLKAAPLSKSAVSRVVATLKERLEAWRTAPKHALDEIRDAFHRIAYAASADAARVAYGAFERAWSKRCPGVVASLREGGDELLTFFRFPKAQWKTLRTTNVIERLHKEGLSPTRQNPGLAAERGRRADPALQPRGERADQVAQDRRVAEDRRDAQPAHGGGGMSEPGSSSGDKRMMSRSDAAPSCTHRSPLRTEPIIRLGTPRPVRSAVSTR